MVIHVASEHQHADFLTKPLSKDAFEFHRDVLMNFESCVKIWNMLQGYWDLVWVSQFLRLHQEFVMIIGPDFCYVCRDLPPCWAPSGGAVSYTRSAAALLYSTLKGVTHIGKHLQIGVTYSSIGPQYRVPGVVSRRVLHVVCRVSHTEDPSTTRFVWSGPNMNIDKESLQHRRAFWVKASGLSLCLTVE